MSAKDSLIWPRLLTLSITTSSSADSTALVSQMIASPGSPITSQTEFSVSNRRACCPALWQSLWGCHKVSFLRPTLFSVYINDVALAAGDSLIHLYADATILYTSGPSLETVLTSLQTSFNAIQLYCVLQLLLNASKTKCMLFNRLLPAPALPSSITTLDGSDLEYVDNYKYPGVWLDCKLSFKTDISNPKLNLESASYFSTKHPSLMLPNIPSKNGPSYQFLTLAMSLSE